ncbi:MAG TPA: TSUP family transporter, partial [Desulfobacteria bacterium]|nr:TSUP family transporter [Desulfobacteria bacterium]
VAGTLPGVFMGAFVRIAYLPDPRAFKLFAGGVLLWIGGKMVLDLLKKKGKGEKKVAEKRFQELVRHHEKTLAQGESTEPSSISAVKVTHFNLSRLGYTFYGEQFDVSFWGIFILSLIVGVVGGIYGIGGGAIIAPFFVAFFKLPVYTVAGAALMGTFVTSVAGVAFYQAMAPFYPHMSVAPDWLLGIMFGLGGMGGMYLGARCQKFVPAGAIKWMLAGIIMLTALKYVLGFFL